MRTLYQLLYFGYDVLFLGHKAFLNSFSFSVCTTIVRIRSFVSAKCVLLFVFVVALEIRRYVENSLRFARYTPPIHPFEPNGEFF